LVGQQYIKNIAAGQGRLSSSFALLSYIASLVAYQCNVIKNRVILRLFAGVEQWFI